MRNFCSLFTNVCFFCGITSLLLILLSTTFLADIGNNYNCSFHFAIAFKSKKENNYCCCNSWKSNTCRESNQERSDTKKEAKKIKSDNFTGSIREKLNLKLYKKLFLVFGAPIIVSPILYVNKT